MNPSRMELGQWGEEQAAEFLQDLGYVIVARNVRTPYGEIDLIAQEFPVHAEGEITTVFIEVKTRSSKKYGFPEEAITPRKQDHIISAAEHYLQEHPELQTNWRIDVIAIELYPESIPIINHFENAFQ